MTELEKVIEAKRKYLNREKKLNKRGTIDVDIVETTPIVWHDRLLMFRWKRDIKKNEEGITIAVEGCYQFVDMETNEVVSSFAQDHSFGSA